MDKLTGAQLVKLIASHSAYTGMTEYQIKKSIGQKMGKSGLALVGDLKKEAINLGLDKEGKQSTKIEKEDKLDPIKKIIPKKISPKKITPEKTTRKKITPEKITTKKITPEKINPKKITPEKISPKKLYVINQIPEKEYYTVIAIANIGEEDEPYYYVSDSFSDQGSLYKEIIEKIVRHHISVHNPQEMKKKNFEMTLKGVVNNVPYLPLNVLGLYSVDWKRGKYFDSTYEKPFEY